MFYPVDSLKRGGRFYLCWVADSWPLRFATITQRQLWSQDIRDVCDDLIEVVRNESGRPSKRFSLRLSSQLLRGLVRLYQRKATVLCNHLCMINATVFKNSNKKYNEEYNGEPSEPRPRQIQPPPVPLLQEQEQDINPRQLEHMIQNSGNVVANVEEITLRENAIPEFQLPPNDNFGEENLEQAIQGLLDRTVETMLVGQPAPLTTSGLALDKSHDRTHDRTHDKTHEKSRLAPELQMEMISEQDITFRKSDGGLLQPPELDKEIPEIPEVPEILVPQEKQADIVAVPVQIAEVPPEPQPQDRTTVREYESLVLEELEEGEPAAKKRRPRRLIIDKHIKISSNVLRVRTANHRIELRCEESSDDIIEIRTPSEVYMRRAAKGTMAWELQRMFLRNLGYIYRPDVNVLDMEEMRRGSRTALERIEEEVEVPIPDAQMPAHDKPETAIIQDITLPELNIDKEINIPKQNIDLELTQKIETITQQARKRASDRLDAPSQSKKKKSSGSGYVSFRHTTAARSQEPMEIEVPPITVPEPEIDVAIPAIILEEADKENIAANMQTPRRFSKEKDFERRVTSMLQEAGLADIQTEQADTTERDREQRKRSGSEGTETPLGSLDRTKVSLGDSDKTTDSKKFIRDEWGTQGTMMKILKLIAKKEQVTVESLINHGPILPGHKALIAARCFTSILKLIQHGYVVVKKRPGTLEIEDMKLGLKFY